MDTRQFAAILWASACDAEAARQAPPEPEPEPEPDGDWLAEVYADSAADYARYGR